MSRKPKKLSSKSDINITPLIDVLLVLIVIFMVITPLTPRGLDTAVPQPPPPGTPPPPPGAQDRTVVVTVDGRGQILINQTPTELRDLGASLQDIFKTRNDRTIFINGDHELFFNDIATVIDIARGAGVDKIGIMPEEIAGGGQGGGD